MHAILRTLCLLLLLLTLPLAHAGFTGVAPVPGELSRYEQRQLYRQAVEDIRAKRWSRYEEVRKLLEDYPLYPYLQYTAMIYSITEQGPETVLPFVEQYADSPVSSRLMENWLFTLALQKDWALFVEHYDERVAGKRTRCYYAQALHETGQKEKAMAAARELWLVDFSQPEECDPVFRFFRNGGGLDREAAWQRFSMTLRAGEYSLASYLMRYLADEDKELAKHFRQLPRDPSLIARTSLFAAQDDHTRDVIVYGIKRLARRDANRAFEVLGKYRETHGFPEAELADLYSWVGVRVALEDDSQGLLDHVPLDLQEIPRVTEARIRLALREQAWSDVLVLIKQLPEPEQQTERWRYWLARVLIASEGEQERVRAREIYQTLATQRNFYGFLAADALGLEYDFEDAPVQVKESEILAIEARPGIQRALELLALGERPEARSEWYWATSQLSETQLQVAARVAQKWGWYRQAIQSMIDAGAWNDLAIRFPLAYQHDFVAQARKWDIPLHWSLAIARQESAFMPDARSSAGARGIMQLMPATARVAANANGLSFNGDGDLVDAGRNIEIGTAYLGQMLRRYNYNRILATAAYNAGPARVDRWRDANLPLDVWIETIPFEETRNYVQNVLMFAAIYARQLAQRQPLIYAHEFEAFSSQRVTLFAEDEITTPDNS